MAMAEAESGSAAAGLIGELPSLEEARGWVGARVDEISGAAVARLEDIYVDAATGEPIWLKVRLGRFGRRTLIPFVDAAPGAGRVWVPHERVSIRHSPELGEGEVLTGKRELEFCLHYGIRPGMGRAAEIKDRGPDAVTARPSAGAGGR
jgi:PRC-barrel domain protein